MAAARRIPLETPPTLAEEKHLERQQGLIRTRIGERLHALRTEAGLSQRALAMKSNITSGYLSELERGMRSPTTDLLVRLGYSLNVTPASFLDEE